MFYQNDSSTWSQQSTFAAAGAPPDFPIPAFNFTITGTGNDAFWVNSSNILQSFPFGTTTQGLSINSIGVGRNSTLLSALQNVGAIASQTWSLFWGLTGEDESTQMDGEVVLGGYDKAKVTGKNLTVPITLGTDCRTNLVVTVDSIDMGFKDGTTQTLLTSPIRMCLDPSFAVITFSAEILNKFTDGAGGIFQGRSEGTATNGLLYDVDDV